MGFGEQRGRPPALPHSLPADSFLAFTCNKQAYSAVAEGSLPRQERAFREGGCPWAQEVGLKWGRNVPGQPGRVLWDPAVSQ